MDIALLSRILKELILVHDEVSLPGLGVFVAELVPASFSDKGFTLNPPYRRLNFVQKTADDRLLAQMYAAANGISEDDAAVILEKTVAGIEGTLKEKKVVVLPSLGRLRATRENNIFFVPEENLDIYPEGSGLESVSLKTHVETPEEIAGAVGSLAAQLNAVPSPSEAPEPAEAAVAPEASVVAGTPAAVAPVAAKPHSLRWWVIPVVLVVLAALALAAFFVLCRLAPDFIDSLLYTPEELRIINY